MATVVWTTSKINELDGYLQELLGGGMILAEALRIIASPRLMNMDVKQVANGYYNHLHNKKEPYMNRKTTTTSTTTTVTTETVVEEQINSNSGSGSLQDAINILTQVNSQIGYFTNRVSELEGLLDNANATIREQRSDLADMMSSNENASKELKMAREMLADQQQENIEMKGRISAMNTELARLKDIESKFNQITALLNGMTASTADGIGMYPHVELGMERNGNLITLNSNKRY